MTLTDEQLAAILRRVDMYYCDSQDEGTVYRDICGLAAAYDALLEVMTFAREAYRDDDFPGGDRILTVALGENES